MAEKQATFLGETAEAHGKEYLTKKRSFVKAEGCYNNV